MVPLRLTDHFAGAGHTHTGNENFLRTMQFGSKKVKKIMFINAWKVQIVIIKWAYLYSAIRSYNFRDKSNDFSPTSCFLPDRLWLPWFIHFPYFPVRNPVSTPPTWILSASQTSHLWHYARPQQAYLPTVSSRTHPTRAGNRPHSTPQTSLFGQHQWTSLPPW